MLMLLSAPLAAFCSTNTVPQPVQVSPVILKLLDRIVRAVKEAVWQLMDVLVTACSWIGPLRSGSAPVRTRFSGIIRMVGLVVAAIR